MNRRERSALATAANLACAVDDEDADEIARILHALDRNQLYALAVVLAAHVDIDKPMAPAYGSTRTCRLATRHAAALFDVTAEAVMSTERSRQVARARMVVMAVARRAGHTTVEIARHFSRDHTTVVYACEKVARDPRLRLAADRVIDRMQFDGDVQAGAA